MPLGPLPLTLPLSSSRPRYFLLSKGILNRGTAYVTISLDAAELPALKADLERRPEFTLLQDDVRYGL